VILPRQDVVKLAAQLVPGRRVGGYAGDRVLEVAPVAAELEGGQRMHRVPGPGGSHGPGGDRLGAGGGDAGVRGVRHGLSSLAVLLPPACRC
jgi:hypothetical protein